MRSSYDDFPFSISDLPAETGGDGIIEQKQTNHTTRSIDMTNKATGMTLRDEFAAKAMPAVYSDYCESARKVGFDEDWRMGVAIDSYAMADAMIKARDQ